ncbi:MAG: hypothetical protein ABI216_15770 [Devosia sp.]
MACKRSTLEVGWSQRELQAATLAATLPDDCSALLAVAAGAVAALHGAILAGDEAAAKAQARRYDAVVWKLNGGGFFGCRSLDPEAGGNLAEAHCRAAPGTVPMWGQYGEFLIEVSGIRAVVEVCSGFGRLCVGLNFYAVDVAAPFISETGLGSHFDTVRGGHTVEDVARAAFTGYLAQKRRRIAPEYRERLAAPGRWSWIEDEAGEAGAGRSYEEADGQIGFSF